MTGDVCRVGRNLVSDQALADILGIGKTKVLFGGHVAEHGRAMPASHGSTDRRGDVVVTRSNVGDQGAEHIEGCLAAFLHLLFDVELDLVEGDVARAFDHDLHVMLPGATGQFAKGLQLSQLGRVGGIVLTSRTQRISEREGAVVTLEDLADVIEARVEGVLLVVIQHPLGQDAAATADDPGDTALHLGQVLDQQSSVDGLVINALLAVLLNDVEEIVLRQLFDGAVDTLQGLIHRDGADRHRRRIDDRGADFIKVDATGGEIHHGVSAVLDRQLELFHFLSGIRGIRRGANIGVHLALAGNADRHRLQVGVVDVGRDDHSPPGHLFHHQRLGQVLPLGHMGHFLGHHPLSGVMHLRNIGLALTGFNPRRTHDPLSDWMTRSRPVDRGSRCLTSLAPA